MESEDLRPLLTKRKEVMVSLVLRVAKYAAGTLRSSRLL